MNRSKRRGLGRSLSKRRKRGRSNRKIRSRSNTRKRGVRRSIRSGSLFEELFKLFSYLCGKWQEIAIGD